MNADSSELETRELEPAAASRAQRVVGWLTVAVSIGITSFWAFWGILENFHEGWYHHHLGKNLLMLLGQYLMPMGLFMIVGLLAIRWAWLGVGLHLAAAAWAIWFFSGSHPLTLATLYVPLFLLAFGFGYGVPQPKRLAYGLLIGIPLVLVIVLAIEPSYRVATRIDDMDRGSRRLAGNGVDLIWAPQGPGWPERGSYTWDEANDICRRLSADGQRVMDEPQDIWRLPTVEEFVRSQHRHHENCGGVWDPVSKKSTYKTTPDKESPLWATDSQVIYWWLEEAGDDTGYKAVFHGRVREASKSSAFPYWSFRAVRDVDANRKGAADE